MKKFIALLSASVLLCSFTVSATSPTAQAILASSGFADSGDAQDAAKRGMTAGEYYNNTIVDTPGVANAMPVGQGGKIIVNGVTTNMTATLSKVDKDMAADAADQATALGGALLNVVSVSIPNANYNVATVNFYLKGLAKGTNVAAKQCVKGKWIDVEVVEVRADHVVLNLKGPGTVAFIAVPDKDAAADAERQAAALGGKLLGVVPVNAPNADYNTVNVNFYLKKLAKGTKVVAKKYVKGKWIDVEIVEVKSNQIVLNIAGSGVVAFIEVPK